MITIAFRQVIQHLLKCRTCILCHPTQLLFLFSYRSKQLADLLHRGCEFGFFPNTSSILFKEPDPIRDKFVSQFNGSLLPVFPGDLIIVLTLVFKILSKFDIAWPGLSKPSSSQQYIVLSRFHRQCLREWCGCCSQWQLEIIIFSSYYWPHMIQRLCIVQKKKLLIPSSGYDLVAFGQPRLVPIACVGRQFIALTLFSLVLVKPSIQDILANIPVNINGKGIHGNAMASELVLKLNNTADMNSASHFGI
mmetsp:Transcript_21999/g.54360  ORF Transcript_21999/g.54360 Transcript_21999/m.54360 type:complete len:249 (+) Transcript_21999:1177-1923(+)